MAKHLLVAAALAAAALSMSTTAFTVSADDANTPAVLSLTDGSWQTQNGKHYYVFPDGSNAVGETEIDGTYYLFGYSGALKTDWQTVDGKRFYYDPATGMPQFGWIDYFGMQYYVSPTEGKLQGIHKIDDALYGFCEEGVLFEEDFIWEETAYQTTEDGRLTNAIYRTDEGLFMTDAQGQFLTGWQTVNGLEYYFEPETGSACFGFVEIYGNYYYISEDAGKHYGLTLIDGLYYPLDATTGALIPGWFHTETGSHYFDIDSFSLLRDTLAEIEGTLFYFDAQACKYSGWLTLEDGTRYFDANGAALRNGLAEVDGQHYYFNADGLMQYGWMNFNGCEYYFCEDGRAATGELRIDGMICVFDANGVLQSRTEPVSAEIVLEVPSYKQYDEAWASEALGQTSTIGAEGCLVTAMAMVHSYAEDAEILPTTMRDMLTFTSGGALANWNDIADLGYTVETYASEPVTEEILQHVLDKLSEDLAVMMGCKSDSLGQHYITITGYVGDGVTLDAADFLMNDPGSGKRTRLSEFLALYPKLYKLVY